MSEEEIPDRTEPKNRPVGGTEYTWCKAVPGGTGVTVLVLLLSKPPDVSLLQNALHKLQNTQPILNSNLHHDAVTGAFSYVLPVDPQIQIQPFDLQSTSEILRRLASNPDSSTLSPFHLILEHEMNLNPWSDPGISSESGTDVFFASLYTLSEEKSAVALRLHTSACDVTSAATLLRELLGLMSGEAEVGGTKKQLRTEVEVSLGIEEYIPSGKANKPFWARGVDMLGYSLNSFRFSNLTFKDADSPRSSKVVRLQINADDTAPILSGCRSRGIKLCGFLAAAGLIAAHSSKGLPDGQSEKYAVVTLVDCRSILDPVLSKDHIGFYHSAILNTHDVKGGDKLWELAKRTYTSFANAKNSNKHFTDMADLNFLMCKAIDNPGLTPSSSLRTSFISVFEDPVIDNLINLQRESKVEDYIGCASVHGVGPSLAIFETIRAGELDCACVFPFPLHSREQMQGLVDDMKRIILDGCNYMESNS